MDFVVVGLTLGTVAVLAGVVLLGWETSRWQRAATHADSPTASARCLAIAADRRSTGEALLYTGAAIVLATVGALAGSLDDRTGAFFVVTTVTVAAAGILLRAYLHRSRHPIPAPPRRPARAIPPATSAHAKAFSVLFADPPRGDEEAVELDAVDDDPVDEPEELASTPSADFIDDAVEAEAVAVAATERDDPDGEDLAPENTKGIG